jgi:hypothetical protein
MPEIRTSRDHPASMAERVNKRLRNSGGDHADVTVQRGNSPNRTFTNIHYAANHVKSRDVRDRTITQTAKDKL